MDLAALQKKHTEIVGAADAIRKTYANSPTDMPADEAAQFDAHMDEADKLYEQIERLERSEKHAKFLREIPEPFLHGTGTPEKKELDSKQMRVFEEFIRWGTKEGDFASLNRELKGLQADLDTSGGYLVAPQLFVRQLLKNVDDLVFIRNKARVLPVGNNESLGVPSLDTDMNDADWTTELATGSTDTATRFGKRELRPHPFAKRIKVSNKLLRSALIDPEAHVRERMAYKFAITEEKGFMTGSGAGQPLGLFTANAQGISTGRDVTIGSTTAITADGLIDVAHYLKPQYWPRAEWILHRDSVKMIRKLKDGNGQYIWQPGIAGGIPNTILDRPYNMSENAPNTFTTGLYVAIFGDLDAYWIADGMDLRIQQLDELYAETDEVGFIARAEADGMPVLEEAFVRGTLA